MMHNLGTTARPTEPLVAANKFVVTDFKFYAVTSRRSRVVEYTDYSSLIRTSYFNQRQV
jgi:hypothetical protein